MMGSGFLKNLIAGKGSDIIRSVGEVADQFITTPHEKEQFNAELQKEVNRHTEAMAVEATRELEVYTKDMANARDMNSRIQESEKASWLSKNIAYLLDAFVGVLWGTITVILFLKVFKVTAENVDMVSLMALHGTVTAVFMISMNFHRGSSIGSERKQRQIEKLTR